MNVLSSDEPSALLNVRQVSALLQISPRSVRRLSDAGRMPRPKRLGAIVRWDRREIETWIAEGCRPVRTPSPKAKVR